MDKESSQPICFPAVWSESTLVF